MNELRPRTAPTRRYKRAKAIQYLAHFGLIPIVGILVWPDVSDGVVYSVFAASVMLALVLSWFGTRLKCEVCGESYFDIYDPGKAPPQGFLIVPKRCEFCDFDRANAPMDIPKDLVSK